MADEQAPKNVTVNVPIEATCPKCGHKFWHKLSDIVKSVADGVGTAIGDAKFGG